MKVVVEKSAGGSSEPEASLGSRLREWIRTAEAEQCLRNLLENSAASDRLGPICEWLSKPGAAPGHETYLVGQGEDVISARLNARMFRYFGGVIAQEARLLKTAVGHIRAISRVRNPGAISRRAGKLNELDEVWVSLRGLSEAISQAGLSLDWRELLDLVRRSTARDVDACMQLKTACSAILPYLPNVKGKPVSAASVTHALFLAENRSHNRPDGYTSDPAISDFTDPMTLATRQALGLPNFNPRRAHALMKSGRYSA